MKNLTPYLCGALIGVPIGVPIDVIGTVQAAPPRRSPALPGNIVLTNLRSPTGRTIYLLLRPAPGTEGQVQEQAERLAASLSATVRQRRAGSLWIVMMTHKERALDMHRLGSDLLVDTGEPTPLSRTQDAGVRLRAGTSDEDMDQEIVLAARRAMYDREDVRPSLVALAQGAAARLLLHGYASQDDVRASLWGQRYQPLLVAHPDAMLMQEVVLAAQEGLTVPIAPLPQGPPRPYAGPPAWEQTLEAAQKTEDQARGWLRSRGKKGPVMDKERNKS